MLDLLVNRDNDNANGNNRRNLQLIIIILCHCVWLFTLVIVRNTFEELNSNHKKVLAV